MRKPIRIVLVYLLSVGLSIAQTTVIPNTTVLPKTTILPGTASVWSVVQHPGYQSGASSVTSFSVTTTSVAAGDVLLLVYYNFAACLSAGSVTDNAGTPDVFTAVTLTTNFCGYYKLSAFGGSTTVSVSGLTSNPVLATVIQIHRASGTAAVDGTATCASNGTALTWNSGVLTSTGASDILIGWAGVVSGTATASAAGNFPLLQNETDSTYSFQSIVHGSLNVTPGSYSYTGSLSGLFGVTSCIMAFK